MITRGFGENQTILTRGLGSFLEVIIQGIRAIVRFASKLHFIVKFKARV